MATFKIHRLKEAHQQNFRWAPHTAGASAVKLNHYEEGWAVEAESEYAAWLTLREQGSALRVGDLLELPSGELRICKYIGFEAATWVVPELKSQGAGAESPLPPSGATPEAASASGAEA
jgi:hypothetical protein